MSACGRGSDWTDVTGGDDVSTRSRCAELKDFRVKFVTRWCEVTPDEWLLGLPAT